MKKYYIIIIVLILYFILFYCNNKNINLFTNNLSKQEKFSISLKDMKNINNKSFKVKDLCNKFKNKNIDLYILGGNKGDGLIYEGLYNYFYDYNIKYNSNIKNKLNSVLFITGSGGYSPSYNSGAEKLNIINSYEETWILPSTFDVSIEKVRKFLKSLNVKKVNIFCRENKSYNDIKNYFKGPVYLDNDTAFNVNYDKWRKKGRGVLYAFRLDLEKNENILKMFSDKKINDVSQGNYTEWKELLTDISKYEEVHTNRAHVSIAATLLGKKTFVYPSNYFKQLEIYKYSLINYPNCKFIDINKKQHDINAREHTLKYAS